MSQVISLHDSTVVLHRVNLTTTTKLLTALADDVDSSVRVGQRPVLPEALIVAVERITAAMKICRPSAPKTQIPLTQLVISLAVPGEDVTAQDLMTRLTRNGWKATNKAISAALYRAVARGIFERRARGVYRLASTRRHTDLAGSTDGPLAASELQRGSYFNDIPIEEEEGGPM